MLLVHGVLANSMPLFSLIASLWGIMSFLRKRGVDGNYWGILAIAEILAAAQALIGGILWLTGGRPGRSVHLLYGVLTVVALPAYYSFTKGRDDRKAALAYGLLCLLLAGISFRAFTTGP